MIRQHVDGPFAAFRFGSEWPHALIYKVCITLCHIVQFVHCWLLFFVLRHADDGRDSAEKDALLSGGLSVTVDYVGAQRHFLLR